MLYKSKQEIVSMVLSDRHLGEGECKYGLKVVIKLCVPISSPTELADIDAIAPCVVAT